GSTSHEIRFSDLLAGRHSIHVRARLRRAVGPPTDAEECAAIEQSAAARRSARVQAGARSAQSRSAGQWHDQRGSCATATRRPGKGQTRNSEENHRVRKEERRKRFGLGAILVGLASSHRGRSRERRGCRAQVAGSSGEERRFPRKEETRRTEREEEKVTAVNGPRSTRKDSRLANQSLGCHYA